MPSPAKSSTFDSTGLHQPGKFQHAIRSFADLNGRKICLIKLASLPIELTKDALIFSLYSLKLTILTLVFLGGIRDRSFSQLYFKSTKELGLSTWRLAIRIIESVSYFFGYTSGVLIHPCLARWVEKKVDYLSQFKFYTLPENLQIFFQAHLVTPNCSYSCPKNLISLPTPTLSPIPLPKKEVQGIYYEPEFSNSIDYHRILGIHPQNLTPKNLTKRYRQLARDYHPDKHQHDQKLAYYEEASKLINNAKDALKKALHHRNPPPTSFSCSRMPVVLSECAPKNTPAKALTSKIPGISIPEDNLSAEDFIKNAENALFQICFYSETPTHESSEIESKCDELLKTIQSFCDTPFAISPSLSKQLEEIKHLLVFKKKFTKNFTFPSSFFLKMPDSTLLQQIIKKLIKIKPILPKNFTNLRDRPFLALAYTVSLYRYYDMLSTLYIASAYSYFQKKEIHKSYQVVHFYRTKVAKDFFNFHKLIKDSNFPLAFFSEKPQKDSHSSTSFYLQFAQLFLPKLMANAAQNCAQMLSIANKISLIIFSDIIF